MLQLRRELEPLRRGDLKVVHSSADAWACVRTAGRHIALVLINNGTQPLDLDLAPDSIGLAPGLSLYGRLGGKAAVSPSNGMLHLSLPARSAAVYSD